MVQGHARVTGPHPGWIGCPVRPIGAHCLPEAACLLLPATACRPDDPSQVEPTKGITKKQMEREEERKQSAGGVGATGGAGAGGGSSSKGGGGGGGGKGDGGKKSKKQGK